VVSLLTLYNAARLRTGILAVSAYASGAGMLSLSAGLFLLTMSFNGGISDIPTIYYSLFIIGFIFLGAGAFKIYQMSRIR
jgi:hypothetical protein